jgi:6-phosphogluconate dehydrogenase (decarboxylating)
MGKGLTDGGIGLSDDMPPDPGQMSTSVEDTDEVKWVVNWAIDHDIPVPVTGMSQQTSSRRGSAPVSRASRSVGDQNAALCRTFSSGCAWLRGIRQLTQEGACG